MASPPLSPDARQVRLALRALEAATADAVAVASGLSLEAATAALGELAAAGAARGTAEGTWLIVDAPSAGRA